MQTSGKSPADGLGEEIKESSALLQLLKEEQALLISADVDGLVKLTEEKNKAVVRVAELAQRRHRILAAAGMEASEAGMTTWLKTAALDAIQAWNALLDLVKEAKEINRVNGLLIGKHLTRNQAALQVLHGSPQSGALYGPNGQSTGQAASRKLVVG
ncbi:flagellar protein FlgN [Herbaspirillum sp. ST 5-3]|uniref:flagella synthesis protein FlgN n=1 Tax=Oxalobacteraceae TaxID=75682 RepID=UPI0010A4BEF7|nr:flagellar protein FlgN [Herbaspirillum sp. ST 5-3]